MVRDWRRFGAGGRALRADRSSGGVDRSCRRPSDVARSFAVRGRSSPAPLYRLGRCHPRPRRRDTPARAASYQPPPSVGTPRISARHCVDAAGVASRAARNHTCRASGAPRSMGEVSSRSAHGILRLRGKSWPMQFRREDIQASMDRFSDSAPGSNGIRCSAWSAGGPAAVDAIFDLIESMLCTNATGMPGQRVAHLWRTRPLAQDGRGGSGHPPGLRRRCRRGVRRHRGRGVVRGPTRDGGPGHRVAHPPTEDGPGATISRTSTGACVAGCATPPPCLPWLRPRARWCWVSSPRTPGLGRVLG